MTERQLPSRFWSKVNKTDSCWNWTASRHNKGYGQFWWQGRLWRAHRLMYTVLHGSIPEGQFVCHSCDNPSCVNPGHLHLGTDAQNKQEMYDRGRDKGAPKSLSVDQITAVKQEYQKGKHGSSRSLATRFQVSQRTIRRAASGRR